jgi:two-component system cell cycle response regulator DivK
LVADDIVIRLSVFREMRDEITIAVLVDFMTTATAFRYLTINFDDSRKNFAIFCLNLRYLVKLPLSVSSGLLRLNCLMRDLYNNDPAAKRILIVEDNEIDLRLLTDVLVVHGYETLQTGYGLEAINLAWANTPDLILMDIQLRDVSGLEVTRRLRKDSRSKRIPIIAVTAFAMTWHEREALDSGCDGYLSKPISIFGFLRTVESILSRLPIHSTGFADAK